MAASKASKKAPAKKAKRKTSAKKKASRKPEVAATPTYKVRPGFVSHTELASADPDATVAWAKKALGWKFGKSVPLPEGPYHMWAYGNEGGGGVRGLAPSEQPGAIPYCEVPRMQAAWDKALAAGARALMPPAQVPGGTGWIAVVTAPGGVPIGYWAPKK